jgi:hypothetical protein
MRGLCKGTASWQQGRFLTQVTDSRNLKTLVPPERGPPETDAYRCSVTDGWSVSLGQSGMAYCGSQLPEGASRRTGHFVPTADLMHEFVSDWQEDHAFDCSSSELIQPTYLEGSALDPDELVREKT